MFKMSRQDTRRQVRLNKLYGEPYTWRQVRTVRRRGFGNLPQLMWQGAGLLSYTYTTEKPEKSALEYYILAYGDFDKALEIFTQQVKSFEDDMGSMISLVNLYQKPITSEVLKFYRNIKERHPQKNVFKIIAQEMEDQDMSFVELINQQ